MELKQTGRGFDLYEFTDVNKDHCTLQKSSIATEDCIWLGLGGNNCRMHLNQSQVKELLPILELFVKTGEIS
jgi:hypothetical protein